MAYGADMAPETLWPQEPKTGNAQRLSLRGLSISMGSSGSGLSSVPRDPERASAEDKWFFALPTKK